MKIGLIARADQTGLGTQSLEAQIHLRPTKTLVVDVCHLSPKNLTLHLERFPGAAVVRGFPDYEDYLQFLTDLDVVLTFETAYNNALYAMADDMDVATILVCNYEFLDHLQDPDLPRPTLFVAPSTWHYDDIPFANKVHLPWPVATEHFPERDRPPLAKHFRHVIGWPAIHDRAGTPEVLSALAHVRNPITVSIACQDPQYAAGLMKHKVPPHVRLRIEALETQDYWDVLGDADVLLAPRRYGGLYLTVDEALANGMPVLMTDVSPNNDWLPPEWLVPASVIGQFPTRAPVDIHAADPRALAERIDLLASNHQVFADAVARAREIGQARSWSVLAPQWHLLLEKAVLMAANSLKS